MRPPTKKETNDHLRLPGPAVPDVGPGIAHNEEYEPSSSSESHRTSRGSGVKTSATQRNHLLPLRHAATHLNSDYLSREQLMKVRFGILCEIFNYKCQGPDEMADLDRQCSGAWLSTTRDKFDKSTSRIKAEIKSIMKASGQLEHKPRE